MSEVKRWAINPTGNEIHDISPNWTLENAQAYSDQYGAGYPLVMVVKLNDYENLKAQLDRAEKVLKYIAEGNDHWAEAEQLAAREYFKEKEQA